MIIGQKVGPYLIVSPLGSGGMGTVYVALHQELGREVAFKVLLDSAVDDEKNQVRFRRERLLGARLSHPNLVTILDGGQEGDFQYLVMELVVGESLRQLVDRESTVPWPFALAIGASLADGLAELHRHEIVHRDIKFENILLSTEGVVKLVDFGLVRRNQSTLVTTEGMVVGTPRYMAPELISGLDASPATDLWAVGIVLFRLITGNLPFPESDLSTFLRTLSKEPIPRLTTVDPRIFEGASDIVAELLETDPRRRTRSAKALHQRLTLLLDQTIGQSPLEILRSGVHRAAQLASSIPGAVATPSMESTRPFSLDDGMEPVRALDPSQEVTTGLRQRTTPSSVPADSGDRPGGRSWWPSRRRARPVAVTAVVAIVLGIALVGHFAAVTPTTPSPPSGRASTIVTVDPWRPISELRRQVEHTTLRPEFTSHLMRPLLSRKYGFDPLHVDCASMALRLARDNPEVSQPLELLITTDAARAMARDFRRLVPRITQLLVAGDTPPHIIDDVLFCLGRLDTLDLASELLGRPPPFGARDGLRSLVEVSRQSAGKGPPYDALRATLLVDRAYRAEVEIISNLDYPSATPRADREIRLRLNNPYRSEKARAVVSELPMEIGRELIRDGSGGRFTLNVTGLPIAAHLSVHLPSLKSPLPIRFPVESRVRMGDGQWMTIVIRGPLGTRPGTWRLMYDPLFNISDHTEIRVQQVWWEPL